VSNANPRLRPGPRSAGRSGGTPPSHQVDLTGGMSQRAGKVRRTMEDPGKESLQSTQVKILSPAWVEAQACAEAG